jgi:hypothetical protein
MAPPPILRLMRNGYNVKSLCDLLNSKPREITAFIRGQLPAGTDAAVEQPATRRRGALVSRSRLMWFLADVVGLFSIIVGPFSRNVGRRAGEREKRVRAAFAATE